MENQNTSNQVNSKTDEQQAEYESLCKVVGNLYLSQSILMMKYYEFHLLAL